MTRTMYDSTRAANIKRNIANPAMVAGYVDEYSIPKWTATEWAMFPDAVKVRIAKKHTTNDGHVLDVEPKLATPEQAPGWVRMRRAAGLYTPAIYVNQSTWAQVQNEFDEQRVAQPLYWVARYDGNPTLPTLNGIKAIAKQYLGDTDAMDYSIVADYWPGVDGNNQPSQEEDVDPADVRQIWNQEAVVQDQINKASWLSPAQMLAFVKYDTFFTKQKVDQVFALLQKQANITAGDLWAAAKDDFIANMKEMVSGMHDLDEEQVAEKLYQMIGEGFNNSKS